MTLPVRVRSLPDALINQIAAGEVVERPASVVKELLENALDSGADRISIEVEQGGKRLIRITDNGSGIHPDDLLLAVTRHATSKIAKLDDLVQARTLGFRGEALPSIASVSLLTLRSTYHDADEGRTLTFDADGTPQVVTSAPVPGTTVTVADLFYNTPARAKFLKADTTEWGHISEAVTEVALAAPQVHFSLMHNGKKPRVFAPADDLAGRARQLFASEITEQMIVVDVTATTNQPFGLSGLTARPGFSRAGRGPQRLLINGRCVKNPTVSHAIYAAYESALPAGRHPIYFLALTVPPEMVDVNVHPAKREVRLERSSGIHHFVREAVRDALGGFRGNSLRLTRMQPTASDDWQGRIRQAVVQSVGHSTDTLQEPRAPYFGEPSTDASQRQPAPVESPSQPSLLASPTGSPTQQSLSRSTPARVVGQLHDTFVLVEQDRQLRIVDQHTAHERILYERLVAQVAANGIASQQLLLPRDVAVSPTQTELLTRHLDDLAKLGLEMEPFGGGAFLVRGVPEALAKRPLEPLIEDLLDDLHQVGAAEKLMDRMSPILATIACHAAVKSGDRLQPAQMEALVNDLEQTDNPHTCPHGRAVTAILDRDTIKTLFDRNWGR